MLREGTTLSAGRRRSKAKKLALSLPSGESYAPLWQMKCSLIAGTCKLGCRLTTPGGHHHLVD